MAQLRHHYERAFESYLRMRKTPYLAVNEVERAVLPKKPDLSVAGIDEPPKKLKSFDFVIYGDEKAGDHHLLLELKGRKVPPSKAEINSAVGADGIEPKPKKPRRARRAECWATMDDIESLTIWQQLFGSPFLAVLVFVYWCEGPLPGVLFHDSFRYRDRWYAARAISVDAYAAAMRVRSPKWRTVDLPPKVFEAKSRPFTDRKPIPLVRRALARPEIPMPTIGVPSSGAIAGTLGA